MYVLRLECSSDEKDRLIAELWERGTLGIVEEDAALRAFFDQPFDVADCPQAIWEPADDRDWIEVSQAQWEPLLVGSRLFLVPSWRADPTPPGRLRLEMQPGLACGTGWGPATRLALEAMESRLRPGMTVLDLGTGAGILAVAAARLGAGSVYACDIDHEASCIARDRFRSESIEVGLFTGTASAVGSSAVDLVVANINAPVLEELAPEISRVLRPGGSAVFSGFTVQDVDNVLAAYPGRGVVLESQEWRALAW